MLAGVRRAAFALTGATGAANVPPAPVGARPLAPPGSPLLPPNLLRYAPRWWPRAAQHAACALAIVGCSLAASPLVAQPQAPTGPAPTEGFHESHDPGAPFDPLACGPEAECYEQPSEWAAHGPSPIATGWRRLEEFATRSTATHGRAVGFGEPLRGTSWLNRPYEVAVDFGALVMTGGPANSVRGGNDLFAALHAGFDWDHYYGTQFRVGWSTPTLDNTAIAGEETSDNFFITDLSMLYYPWGDSKIRPYFRGGVGLTDVEFTNVSGARQQEMLFTLPFGIGVKHQFRRWLVWRLELMDNLALASNEADTMNNLTLTFGLEGRFGGRPTGYWAWSPRGYAW